MKNSEASTHDTDRFQLPKEVKEELRDTLGNLKELLKDNSKFFNELVSKCLLVGKPSSHNVYSDDISQMVRAEYPDLLKYEEGRKLLSNTGAFIRELCLKSEATQHCIKDYKKAENFYTWREAIECEVSNFLNIESEVNILGDGDYV